MDGAYNGRRQADPKCPIHLGGGGSRQRNRFIHPPRDKAREACKHHQPLCTVDRDLRQHPPDTSWDLSQLQRQIQQWTTSSECAKHSKRDMARNSEVLPSQAGKAHNITTIYTNTQVHRKPVQHTSIQYPSMGPHSRHSSVRIHQPSDTGSQPDIVTLHPTMTSSLLSHHSRRRDSHCRDQNLYQPAPYRLKGIRSKSTWGIKSTSQAGRQTLAHFSPQRSTAEQTSSHGRAPTIVNPKSTLKTTVPQRPGKASTLVYLVGIIANVIMRHTTLNSRPRTYAGTCTYRRLFF